MRQQALSAAVLVATVAGGTVVTYAYDRACSPVARLATGLCTGLAVLGLAGFLLAMRFGLTQWVIVVSGLIVASPALLLASRDYRRRVRHDCLLVRERLLRGPFSARAGTNVRSALLAAAALVLWRVAARSMFVLDDGIYTGISHNFGDLPFHLAVINRFVYGGNLPPEHPSFAGAGFTYPFLTDFIAAMFVSAGAPVREVLVWSTMLVCLALVVLLHRWTLELTDSQAAACLAPALAMLSGGLGWWRFVTDVWQRDAGLLSILARLPHDYTITPDNAFRWGNLVTTLLVTQRGLLLGLPLAVIVFRLWWSGTVDGEHQTDRGRTRMIAAGVIAGTLPLVHAHSYAVVLGMGACLALLARDRWTWLPFFAWSLAIGLPQIWWIAQASTVQAESFIAWSIGWDRGTQNVVTFWLKNTGALIPLLVVVALWRPNPAVVSKRLLLFYVPFVLCFAVPNLFRLAPWIWDNIKVLVYWFVASVPLVASLLARLMRSGPSRAALAAMLLLTLTLAGALDFWRVASGAFRWQIFDRAGTEFARVVSERTSPGALILHAPVHNHPIALTGRRSLMGYPGHVWSHGLNSGTREADIRRIYAGEPRASALLSRYGVDYVVVGPLERIRLGANEKFFGRYPRVAESGGYHLYEISNVGGP